MIWLPSSLILPLLGLIVVALTPSLLFLPLLFLPLWLPLLPSLIDNYISNKDGITSAILLNKYPANEEENYPPGDESTATISTVSSEDDDYAVAVAVVDDSHGVDDSLNDTKATTVIKNNEAAERQAKKKRTVSFSTTSPQLVYFHPDEEEDCSDSSSSDSTKDCLLSSAEDSLSSSSVKVAPPRLVRATTYPFSNPSSRCSLDQEETHNNELKPSQRCSANGLQPGKNHGRLDTTASHDASRPDFQEISNRHNKTSFRSLEKQVSYSAKNFTKKMKNIHPWGPKKNVPKRRWSSSEQFDMLWNKNLTDQQTQRRIQRTRQNYDNHKSSVGGNAGDGQDYENGCKNEAARPGISIGLDKEKSCHQELEKTTTTKVKTDESETTPICVKRSTLMSCQAHPQTRTEINNDHHHNHDNDRIQALSLDAQKSDHRKFGAGADRSCPPSEIQIEASENNNSYVHSSGLMSHSNSSPRNSSKDHDAKVSIIDNDRDDNRLDINMDNNDNINTEPQEEKHRRRIVSFDTASTIMYDDPFRDEERRFALYYDKRDYRSFERDTQHTMSKLLKSSNQQGGCNHPWNLKTGKYCMRGLEKQLAETGLLNSADALALIIKKPKYDLQQSIQKCVMKRQDELRELDKAYCARKRMHPRASIHKSSRLLVEKRKKDKKKDKDTDDDTQEHKSSERSSSSNRSSTIDSRTEMINAIKEEPSERSIASISSLSDKFRRKRKKDNVALLSLLDERLDEDEQLRSISLECSKIDRMIARKRAIQDEANISKGKSNNDNNNNGNSRLKEIRKSTMRDFRRSTTVG